MQINEQFWGGDEQSVEIINGVKRTSYTLKDAFNQSEGTNWILPLNEELDTSISPWAINKNADVVKIAYGTSYRTNPNTLDYALPLKFYSIHDLEKEKSIPIYFNIPYYTGNGGTAFNWFTRNGLSQANIYDPVNVSIGNYRTMVYPIREFNYSKFLFYVQLVYGSISDTDLGNPNITTVDNYFSSSYTDRWRDEHPIVGINFIPYYRGWNTQQSNWWQQCGWNMNTIGRKKPCEVAPPGAAVGYNVDFIDDFMSLISSSNAIGAWRNSYGGAGRIRIYNGSSWAMNEEQCASIVLSTSYDTEPILHVPIIDDESKWTTNSQWNGTQDIQFRTELDYTRFATYAEMKEYILTQAAYLGTWFVTNTDTLTSNATVTPGSSDGWYLGEIDENGVTTGNYKQGAATSELQNSEWVDPWQSSGWKGRDDDPTDYDENQTSIISTAHGDPTYNSKEYLMSENALSQLLRFLNEFKLNVSGELQDDFVVNAFGDTDPVKAIISVIKYPFDIIHNFNGNGTDVIISGSNIGNWFNIANASIAVGVSPELPVTPTLYTIDLTSSSEIYEIDWNNTNFKYGTAKIPYYEKFKCFLDYEPYCTANLYIPFCGSVRIDPELFCGREIGVDYMLSPIDGTVKAFVKRDNLVIDTLTGNIGNSIEINSSDELSKSNNVQQLNATIQAQKMNTAKKWSNVAFGAVGGAVVSGGVGAVVGGIVSTINATFDTAQNNLTIEQKQLQIDNAETPFKQLQSGGGYLSQCDEYAIRLVVYRPETLPTYTFENWNDYGKTKGFATYEINTLDNYSGYVECSNIILDNISATDKEKEIIFNMLKGGVFI